MEEKECRRARGRCLLKQLLMVGPTEVFMGGGSSHRLALALASLWIYSAVSSSDIVITSVCGQRELCRLHVVI